MSRLLIAFIGVIVASLFLVGERPIKETFRDTAETIQVVKAFLKYIQYDRSKPMIGFYNLLLVNRVRRLRTNGDTTLEKDVAKGLIDQMKERSRWDNFETWLVSSWSTAGTPMEDNLISRVASLPIDPTNYLRFMNALVTLYRDEFSLLRNQKVTQWTRREIDEGTAQDNYTPPPKVPSVIGPEMEKYLVEHIGVLDKLWPAIEKLIVKLTQESNDMNELLNAREKMPNGFTMRIWVDFEEKIFQKPLAEIMKFMIDNQAESRQVDAQGKKQMTLENAKIATTLDIVKLSGVDFTPWFVPIYKGQKKTYKERFQAMGFDPGLYLKLGNFCVAGLKAQLKALQDHLGPVKEKKPTASTEGFTDELLFENFKNLAPEDQPFTGQVRDIIYRRFAILNQAEPAFKEQMTACKKMIDEMMKYKEGAAAGKYQLTTKTPLPDDKNIEGFYIEKQLPIGHVL